MTIILDASAAIEVVLRRNGAVDFINRLLNAERVIATDFFRAETANVISKYVKGSFLSKENGFQSLEFVKNMVDEYIPIRENEVEAFSESIRLNHPVYDMLYLTLARRTGGVLLTCDKKLAALCKSEGIPIVTGMAA
jgi:predicted nucleic acid-binding protein